MQTVEVDGTESSVWVPNVCDPYYRDTGDPPDDESEDQVVDPAPDEVEDLGSVAERPMASGC